MDLLYQTRHMSSQLVSAKPKASDCLLVKQLIAFDFEISVAPWWHSDKLMMITYCTNFTDVCSTFGQRRRRWTSIKPTLGNHLVLIGGGGGHMMYRGQRTQHNTICAITMRMWVIAHVAGGEVLSHIGPGLFKFCVNIGVTSSTLAPH